MAKQTPEIEEEDLDLVAIDGEVIRTMLRTQGQILGMLQSINIALLGLTANVGMANKITGDLNDNIGKLCDLNIKLTQFMEGKK